MEENPIPLIDAKKSLYEDIDAFLLTITSLANKDILDIKKQVENLSSVLNIHYNK